jgi:hypothetical protein
MQLADDARIRTIRTNKAGGANRSSFNQGYVPLGRLNRLRIFSLRLAVTLPAGPDRGPPPPGACGPSFKCVCCGVYVDSSAEEFAMTTLRPPLGKHSANEQDVTPSASLALAGTPIQFLALENALGGTR